MKILTLNTQVCTGCRMCELACSVKKTGEFNPARSRIYVVGFEDEFCFPMACFHCEQAFCARACPNSALVRDEATGMVKVVKDKCTQCKECILACPFGGLSLSEDGTVVNCDLCQGEPECVSVCPSGALGIAEVDRTDKAYLLDRISAVNEKALLDVAALLLSVNNRKFLAGGPR